MLEGIFGGDASYLRRLGALCALGCGSAAALGAVLLALQPCGANLVALVGALGCALGGARLARSS